MPGSVVPLAMFYYPTLPYSVLKKALSCHSLAVKLQHPIRHKHHTNWNQQQLLFMLHIVAIVAIVARQKAHHTQAAIGTSASKSEEPPQQKRGLFFAAESAFSTESLRLQPFSCILPSIGFEDQISLQYSM